MRPKKPQTTSEGDLFRARLEQIINMRHELVQLASKIDWDWIDQEIAPLYSDKGRPGIETRFVIGLLLLKHIYGLSDEGVCERWIHDPYFQHFTGETFFQHDFPHERSDLSHWRKRLGSKLELLLAESLRVNPTHDRWTAIQLFFGVSLGALIRHSFTRGRQAPMDGHWRQRLAEQGHPHIEHVLQRRGERSLLAVLLSDDELLDFAKLGIENSNVRVSLRAATRIAAVGLDYSLIVMRVVAAWSIYCGLVESIPTHFTSISPDEL